MTYPNAHRPPRPVEQAQRRRSVGLGEPEPIRERHWFRQIAAGVVLFGALAPIADFFQPAGPFLTYALIVFGTLLIAAAVMSFNAKWRYDSIPAVIALTILVSGLAAVKYLQRDTNSDRGLLAETFGSVRGLQGQMLGIHDQLTTVNDGIGRLETGFGRLEGSGRTIDERTQRIEQQVKLNKRETSENPRKELANRGIAWSNEAFMQALRAEDEETLQLFLDGGFGWHRATSADWLLQAIAKLEDVAILRRLASQKEKFQPIGCRPPSPLEQSELECSYADENFEKVARQLGKETMVSACGNRFVTEAKTCKAQLTTKLAEFNKEYCSTGSCKFPGSAITEMRMFSYRARMNTALGAWTSIVDMN